MPLPLQYRSYRAKVLTPVSRALSGKPLLGLSAQWQEEKRLCVLLSNTNERVAIYFDYDRLMAILG